MLLFTFGIKSLIHKHLSKKFDFFVKHWKLFLCFRLLAHRILDEWTNAIHRWKAYEILFPTIYIYLYLHQGLNLKSNEISLESSNFLEKTLKTSFRFLTHNSPTINGNNLRNTSLESWWNSLSNGVYIISFAHKQFDPHFIDFGVKSWHFRVKR